MSAGAVIRATASLALAIVLCLATEANEAAAAGSSITRFAFEDEPGARLVVAKAATNIALRSSTEAPTKGVTTIAPSTSLKSRGRSRTPLLVLLALATVAAVAAVIGFLRRARTGAAPRTTPRRQADVPIPPAPRIIDPTRESTLASTIGEANRATPVASVAMASDTDVDDGMGVPASPASTVHVIEDDGRLDELDLAAFGSVVEPAARATDGDAPIAGSSMVCVLGAPAVDGRDDLSERTVEIAVRLALEPDGVSINDLGGALGHGGASEQQARSKTTTLVSRARGQLGDLDGEPLLPKIARGEPYRLHPRVVTDLARFERLIDSAAQLPAREAIDALRAALGLVRGRPFGDAPYAWAANDGWVGRAQDVVADAAFRLVELARNAGEMTIVAFAIDKGLLAAPDDERLSGLRATIVDRETPT